MTDDKSDLEERILEAKRQQASAVACPAGHTTGVREIRSDNPATRNFWCVLCGRKWTCREEDKSGD